MTRMRDGRKRRFCFRKSEGGLAELTRGAARAFATVADRPGVAISSIQRHLNKWKPELAVIFRSHATTKAPHRDNAHAEYGFSPMKQQGSHRGERDNNGRRGVSSVFRGGAPRVCIARRGHSSACEGRRHLGVSRHSLWHSGRAVAPSAKLTGIASLATLTNLSPSDLPLQG